MPPSGLACFTNVIGNPGSFCSSCVGNTFGQADLMKPLMSLIAGYMLWQSFAQVTWHILLFLLVAIVSKDKAKLF